MGKTADATSKASDLLPVPQEAVGSVLHVRVHALAQGEVLACLTRWAEDCESRYVCLCNVHVVVTANQQPALSRAVNGADLGLPDGAPIAWVLRRMGFPQQRRIAGPDLLWHLCERAAEIHIPIFLLGGTPDTLQMLEARLQTGIHGLHVAGAHSPPFRELTASEDEAIVRSINESGARLVLVGLGCPKQELWMAAHRGRVQAVMLGLGAAFDFHAGTAKRAPLWMQRAGFEWLHRLLSEPRRLWKRYLVTNSIFAVKVTGQLLRGYASRQTAGPNRGERDN